MTTALEGRLLAACAGLILGNGGGWQCDCSGRRHSRHGGLRLHNDRGRLRSDRGGLHSHLGGLHCRRRGSDRALGGLHIVRGGQLDRLCGLNYGNFGFRTDVVGLVSVATS